MSGDTLDAEKSVGIVGDLFSRLFTGTAADPIIAILLLVVGIMGFALWKQWKRLDEKDARLLEKDNKLADVITQSNKELKDMSDKYLAAIEESNRQQLEQTRIVNESLVGAKMLLTEIKTLLSVMSPPRKGN